MTERTRGKEPKTTKPNERMKEREGGKEYTKKKEEDNAVRTTTDPCDKQDRTQRATTTTTTTRTHTHKIECTQFLVEFYFRTNDDDNTCT